MPSSWLGDIANAPSAVNGVVDIYVDDVNGNDANIGTQALPVKTLSAAYKRIPFYVTDLTRVFVAPHGGAGYSLVEFGPRVLRNNVWIIGTGETALKATAAAQGGSTNQLVVTTGGMTADAFRGKTIEIMSGAALGDKRTIRNNTTTDIVPVEFFSATIASGDQYRVIEPSTVLRGPSADFTLASDVGFPTADPVADDPPPSFGVAFENLRLSLFADPAIEGSLVFFFGCELVGGIRRLFGGSDGQWKWGAELASTVPMAVVRGARLPTSYRGWALFADNSILSVKTTISGYLVSSGFNAFGGHYELIGGSIIGNLRATGGSNGPCVINAANHISDAPWFLVAGVSDVVRAFLPGAVINMNQVQLSSSGGTAVLATRQGIVQSGDDTRIAATGVGLKASLGGRVEFDSSFDGGQFSATGNQTECGQAPVTQTIAAYTSVGSFLAEATSDGSVVQRVA